MAYNISQVEKQLGVPRWRIDHCIRFHNVCNPKFFGRVRSFSKEDLKALSFYFKGKGGKK